MSIHLFPDFIPSYPIPSSQAPLGPIPHSRMKPEPTTPKECDAMDSKRHRLLTALLRRPPIFISALFFLGMTLTQVRADSSSQGVGVNQAPVKEIPLLLQFELLGSDPSHPRDVCGIALSQDGKILCPRQAFRGVNKVRLKRPDRETSDCSGWLAQDLDQDWIVLQSPGQNYQPALMGAPTQVPLAASEEVLLAFHAPGGATRLAPLSQSPPPKNQKPEMITKGFWISTSSQPVLPGAYVLNEKGVLLGLITEIQPERHLARVARVYGPLDILEQAALQGRPFYWKDLSTGLPRDLSLTDPTISSDLISTILQKPVDSNTTKLCDKLLTQKGASALAWYVASLGYSRVHQDDQAMESAHQVTVIAPKAWEGWALYGNALVQAGKFDQALDTYQTAADQGAPLKEVGVPIEICTEHSGNLNLLAERIQHLIDQEPQLYGAWLLEGRLQVTNKQLAKATHAYVQALRLNPQSITAWTSLAEIYDSLQDWPSSVQAYQVLTLLLPNEPNLWYNLGLAQKKLGRVQEARISFEQTAALNPKDRDSWLQITRLDYEIKNWPDFKWASNKVLQLDPKNEEVRKALAEIPPQDG